MEYENLNRDELIKKWFKQWYAVFHELCDDGIYRLVSIWPIGVVNVKKLLPHHDIGNGQAFTSISYCKSLDEPSREIFVFERYETVLDTLGSLVASRNNFMRNVYFAGQQFERYGFAYDKEQQGFKYCPEMQQPASSAVDGDSLEKYNYLTTATNNSRLEEQAVTDHLRLAINMVPTRMRLYIAWKKEDVDAIQLIALGEGVVRCKEDEQVRVEYDQCYAPTGIVFVGYRTYEYREQERCYSNHFIELRIGVDELIRFGSTGCCFETRDATAYERAAAHIAKYNEYVGEQRMFVCIGAGTEYIEGVGDVGVWVDGNGDRVSPVTWTKC